MQETELCHRLSCFLGIVWLDTLRRRQPNELLQRITSVIRVLSDAREAINPLCDTIQNDNCGGLSGTARREPVEDHVIDGQIVPEFGFVREFCISDRAGLTDEFSAATCITPWVLGEVFEQARQSMRDFL